MLLRRRSFWNRLWRFPYVFYKHFEATGLGEPKAPLLVRIHFAWVSAFLTLRPPR